VIQKPRFRRTQKESPAATIASASSCISVTDHEVKCAMIGAESIVTLSEFLPDFVGNRAAVDCGHETG
jgi:hypothetical protein